MQFQPDPCASVSSVSSVFYFVLIASVLWSMVVAWGSDRRRDFNILIDN